MIVIHAKTHDRQINCSTAAAVCAISGRDHFGDNSLADDDLRGGSRWELLYLIAALDSGQIYLYDCPKADPHSCE